MFLRNTLIAVLLIFVSTLGALDPGKKFVFHIDQKTLLETFHFSDGLEDNLISRMRVITGMQAQWRFAHKWLFSVSLANQIFNPISAEGSSLRISGLNFRELSLSYRKQALTGLKLTAGRQSVSLAEGLLFSNGAPLTEEYLRCFDAADLTYSFSGKPFHLRFIAYKQGQEDNLPELFSDKPSLHNLQDAQGALLSLSWIPGRIQGAKHVSIQVGAHVAHDNPHAPLEAKITWIDLSWHWPLFSPRTIFQGELAYQTGTIGQNPLQGYAMTWTISRDLSPLFLRKISLGTTCFSGDRTNTSRVESWYPLYGETQRFGPWAAYLLSDQDRPGLFTNVLVVNLRADISFLPNMTHECTVNWAQNMARDARMNAYALDSRERGTWIGIRNVFTISETIRAYFSWEHLYPGSYFKEVSRNSNWISAGFFWTLF